MPPRPSRDRQDRAIAACAVQDLGLKLLIRKIGNMCKFNNNRPYIGQTTSWHVLAAALLRWHSAKNPSMLRTLKTWSHQGVTEMNAHILCFAFL